MFYTLFQKESFPRKNKLQFELTYSNKNIQFHKKKFALAKDENKSTFIFVLLTKIS